MKKFSLCLFALLILNSNLSAQDSWEGVDGSMIFPKDTIRTTIVIEGDSEVDIIKAAIQDPEMIHMFNFYQDIKWTSEIAFDGPAVINNRTIKRVRFIKVVAICSEPLRDNVRD